MSKRHYSCPFTNECFEVIKLPISLALYLFIMNNLNTFYSFYSLLYIFEYIFHLGLDHVLEYILKSKKVFLKYNPALASALKILKVHHFHTKPDD